MRQPSPIPAAEQPGQGSGPDLGQGNALRWWSLAGAVEPGSTKLHFSSYDGLCVGDGRGEVLRITQAPGA